MLGDSPTRPSPTPMFLPINDVLSSTSCARAAPRPTARRHPASASPASAPCR